MRAIRLHAFGHADNLRHERVPDLEPGPGQVRIAVAAAGVHLLDVALREGRPLGPVPLPELPTVPGREVAGTVDALGEGVDPQWLGRRVVAHLGQAPGGYAELAVTGVERLHALPHRVSEDHAVAMIGTGRTAMGILRFADPSPADTVLVLAAAGGVGSLLVQYARHRGATVVGAAGGPEKAAAVRELGADLAVDYTAGDWADRVREKFGDRPLTHLFEGVGGHLGRTALSLLAPGGTHLSYGHSSAVLSPEARTAPSREEQERLGITSRSVTGKPMFDRIGGPGNLRVLEEEAMGLAAAGVLVPLVHHFPLADAARAHRALESRATLGKVVLVP
ncbi:zinc-binding dehydrogenase [Streptomyces glaucosporus]|uniref:Zinc-binding dehydrogenase n=1 Tax=Streptomyces glaucosporus TaxID=284044 RepID=A0ABP5UVE0_9ACTN